MMTRSRKRHSPAREAAQGDEVPAVEKSPLLQLPIDIKLHVLKHCDIHSFYNLITSCRTFYDMHATGITGPAFRSAAVNGMTEEAHELYRAISIRQARVKWIEIENQRLQTARENHRNVGGPEWFDDTWPPEPRAPFPLDVFEKAHEFRVNSSAGTYVEEVADIQLTTRYFARLFQKIQAEKEQLAAKEALNESAEWWPSQLDNLKSPARHPPAGPSVGGTSSTKATTPPPTINASSDVADIEKALYDVWLAAVATQPLNPWDKANLWDKTINPPQVTNDHAALYRPTYTLFGFYAPETFSEVRFANMSLVATFLDATMNALVVGIAPGEVWASTPGIGPCNLKPHHWFPLLRRLGIERTLCRKYGQPADNRCPYEWGIDGAIPPAFGIVNGDCENFVARNNFLELDGKDGRYEYNIKPEAFIQRDRIVAAVSVFKEYVRGRDRTGATRTSARLRFTRRVMIDTSLLSDNEEPEKKPEKKPYCEPTEFIRKTVCESGPMFWLGRDD
ncbi:hypothetical protein ABW21_db0204887 [Orbilia brochopaga]|nr:hypothetical protein ABW21_db0204887 [Drechslerella brochopaga]